MTKIKRIYDAVSQDDGKRILSDRLESCNKVSGLDN